MRQLLQYKVYRDAAGALSQRAEIQSNRFNRPRVGLPSDEPEGEIEDVQIWDLLTAFNKLLSAVGKQRVTHDVVYDDTPITLHAADVLDRLEREGPAIVFERIFEGRTRGEMIGLFLAMLELIRQDPGAVWDAGRGTVTNSAFGISPRIITVAVIDPEAYSQQRRYSIATVPVRVRNLVGFFVESVGGMTGVEVTGVIVPVPGRFDQSAPTITANAAFLRSVALVR